MDAESGSSRIARIPQRVAKDAANAHGTAPRPRLFRRTSLRRGAALLLGACWVFGGEPASAFSLVPNGSFENGCPTPTHWQIDATPGPGGRAAFATDSETTQDGARSLQLSVSGPASVEVASLPFDVPLEPRTRTYLLSLRYRGIGLSTDQQFRGVNVWFVLAWQDAAGHEIDSVSIGAPYSPQPWSPLLAIAEAPAQTVRAIVRAHLVAREDSLPTTIWLDDVRLRPWRTEPMQNSRVSMWSVGEDRIQGSQIRVVADDDTPSGLSARANPRFTTGQPYLVSGLEVPDLHPTAYRVDFRIRTSPTRTPDVVFQLDSGNTAAVNRWISSLDVRGTDLPRTPRYHDIPLPFVATPGGRSSFRVRWLGGVSTWVDSITLTEERLVDAAKFDDVLSP